MISSVTNNRCFEFRGLQADFDRVKNDTAWNEKVGNGSVFIIIPSFDVYVYDEENKKWEITD